MGGRRWHTPATPTDAQPAHTHPGRGCPSPPSHHRGPLTACGGRGCRHASAAQRRLRGSDPTTSSSACAGDGCRRGAGRPLPGRGRTWKRDCRAGLLKATRPLSTSVSFRTPHAARVRATSHPSVPHPAPRKPAHTHASLPCKQRCYLHRDHVGYPATAAKGVRPGGAPRRRQWVAAIASRSRAGAARHRMSLRLRDSACAACVAGSCVSASSAVLATGTRSPGSSWTAPVRPVTIHLTSRNSRPQPRHSCRAAPRWHVGVASKAEAVHATGAAAAHMHPAPCGWGAGGFAQVAQPEHRGGVHSRGWPVWAVSDTPNRMHAPCSMCTCGYRCTSVTCPRTPSFQRLGRGHQPGN